MKTAIGVDLGTYAIKCVEVQRVGSNLQVVKAVSVPNPVGTVIPAQQKDRDTLIATLKQIFKEYKFPPQNIRIGLPESLVSTKIISIPSLSDAELASAIGWQAEQYIPIPAEDLQLEYQVLYRPPKQHVSELMRVLLLGTSKKTVAAFSSIYADAQLEVVSMETQMLALYRLMSMDTANTTTLVVLFGASSMDMLTVHNKELAFVYSSPNAGTVLSRAVERTLGLDASQSESYKRTYGLDPAQLEGKVAQALAPVFQASLVEIQKAMQYFAGSHQGSVIKRIMFAGGSASLSNLIPTVAQAIPAEVTLLNPFAYVPLAQGMNIAELDIPSYSIAVSLAAGGVS